MGLKAIAVDTDDAIGAAWEEALAADEPTVLDMRCDPEMPPIPPHATYDQAKDLVESILRGDPARWHLMAQGMKTKAQEFMPHRS
jgi:pyruvate dehydrogenase (quinone)